MPTLTQHAPGTFCWPELFTTDPNAAKKFYPALFGWSIKDIPMGPDAVYTIFTREGQDVAACYGNSPDMVAQGVPPHWMAYVSTDSADQTAARVKANGGTVIKEPFDVPGVGRMAVLQDSTGATFCCWQSNGHIGVGVLDEPGALTWTELTTSDPKRAGEFYRGVFGWNGKQWPMGDGSDYTVFLRGEANAGGMMKTPAAMQGVPPCWTSYFMVENCDAMLEKAVKLGGKALTPAMDVPGIGRFAILADPQGAAFAVITYAAE